MNFTEEMLAEDEKRWHARDVVTELGYCGNYMRDRNNMTNLDIRFYAYIMRKAHEILKRQEPIMRSSRTSINGFSLVWTCGACGSDLRPNNRAAKYCYNCGQAVKWE